jgi:hypothetical protein
LKGCGTRGSCGCEEAPHSKFGLFVFRSIPASTELFKKFGSSVLGSSAPYRAVLLSWVAKWQQRVRVLFCGKLQNYSLAGAVREQDCSSTLETWRVLALGFHTATPSAIEIIAQGAAQGHRAAPARSGRPRSIGARSLGAAGCLARSRRCARQPHPRQNQCGR